MFELRIFLGMQKRWSADIEAKINRILEIWEITIVNGYGGKDYLAILEHKRKGGVKDSDKDIENLEWIAQKEDKECLEKMMLKDEMDN